MPKTYAGSPGGGSGSGANTALSNLASVAINTALLPASTDSAALGSTGKQWADLFLAEGGVIDFDNGDATITQAGNVVTLAGADLKVTTPGNVSTSVLTTDGVQTVTGKTNLPIIIASSGTASSTTNSASEANLAVVTIPAGLMGTNGRLMIEVYYKYVGTAGTKTPTIRHSTTSGDTSAGTVLYAVVTAANALQTYVAKPLYNSNSASAQIIISSVPGPNATVGTAFATGAIDTTNASYINFNALVANSGDTAQVVAYTVTFYPGV